MKLSDFFEKHPKVAVAFSGGVDSAYLLYSALNHAKSVKAYYVKTVFQPHFELDDARRFAVEHDLELKIITLDILSDNNISKNPDNRCYFCKKRMFSAITAEASADGYRVLLDGTNASDDYNDRPGMKALEELSVLSPLRECGLTKEDIRRLSKAAGLFTWNKQAYTCLATRIPKGDIITEEKLERTEKAENYLLSLGYRDFRVRLIGDSAKIQINATQINKLISERKQIVSEFKKYYSSVLLDLEARDE
ncbi:MAG: ATP-dependent sacrificial sulfur transferase LarE [Clostridiales bacterium]|mgnify:CR=1 FL=1|nr:ATP-dependent sacrificial sulfur transferase LarE [Clostridiales bacterium]